MEEHCVTWSGASGLAAAVLVLGASVASGQAALPTGAWTTVDEVQLLPAAAGAHSWIGRHVSLDGDTLVTSGGLFDGGSVYVFVRGPTGWSEQAELQPTPEPLTGACAIYGDTLAVGAYTEALNGPESGAVYVYRRSGEVWALEQVLRASDGFAQARFGWDVDLAGGALIVGAPAHSAPTPGKAYVFHFDGSAWNEEAILMASTPSVDELGHEVDIDGDTVVAAALQIDACFVFRRVGGVWVQEAKLVGETTYYGFGQTAALSGDTVVVGVPNRDDDTGAVHVYTRQSGVWQQQALLIGSAAADDHLGVQVAIDGDLVVASSMADEGRPAGGCALVFRRSGSQWEELGRLVPRTPDSSSRIGDGLAVDGSRVAVGAPWADVVGLRSGAAYIFPIFQGAASNYGASQPNSAFVVARMALTGSPSLGGGLTLYALGAPAAKSGLFFYGTQTASLPFGNGTLCISPFTPGLRRLPPLAVTDDFGTTSLALDPARLPPGTAPGTTLFFQFWFRDQPAGGAASNLTDGLGVTFEP